MDLRPLVDASDPVLKEAVRDFLGCAAGQPCGQVAAEASPITYVDPTDPPMILINSDDEIIPVDQARSMASALDDAGIDNRLWIVQGGHGAGYGGGNKILDRIIPDLQAWVDGRPAPAVTQGETEGAGKGQEGEPASADAGKGGEPMPTAGSQPEQPVKSSKPAGRVEESAPVVAIAAAMIALILVIVLVVVIVRLRRKVASLSIAERPAQTSAEGT
jgi:hypothetical protein